jgi:hypothetical protein
MAAMVPVSLKPHQTKGRVRKSIDEDSALRIILIQIRIIPYIG